VFLLEPDRTPYDLRFHLFRIPVRVHPMFWVVAAFLGWPWFTHVGALALGLWIACVFFSILIHEMGHVVMGRIFGRDGHIVLYSFGGLAIGSSDLRKRWQRIAVSFAGPLAQFILFGILYALTRWVITPERAINALGREGAFTLLYVLEMLKDINLFWPLLNLVPIWPLDGGKIARDVLDGLMPGRGVVISLAISGCLAGLLAIHALMSENGRPLIPYVPPLGYLSAFLFGGMCVQNFQEMQAVNERRRWNSDDDLPW
jgi:stage IV sporulation protein FB